MAAFLFLLFLQYDPLFRLPHIEEILLPLIFLLQGTERILPAIHCPFSAKTFRGNQKDLHRRLQDDNHWANENIVVPVPYRRKTIVDKYNQIDLIFKEPFSIQFRLYNNGIAFRIGTRFKDSIVIVNENVLFEVDASSSLWFAHMDKRQNVDRFHTSFEAIYKKQSLNSIADTMLTYAPVTVSLPNGYHLAISDADLF